MGERTERRLLVVLIAVIGAAAVVRIHGAVTEGKEREPTRPVSSAEDGGDAMAPTPVETTEATDIELETRSYDRGDCVTWDQTPGYVRTDVVDCAEPHLVEVVGAVELPQAPDAPFPSDAEWEVLYRDRCRPLVVEYLDGALDPYGVLGEGGVNPLEEGWRQGDRTMWCGVRSVSAADRPTPAGMTPFAGRATDLDQSLLMPIGTCLELVGGSPQIVSCGATHHFVILGHLDLGGLPVRPTDPDITTRCEASLAVDGQAPSTPISFIGFDRDSWAAGSRKGNCIEGSWSEAGDPIPIG